MLQGISKKWLPIIQTADLMSIQQAVLKMTPENRLCPSIDQWFNWARILDAPEDIRIIIVGMDPYPRREDAHGLAFSSLSSVPASLKNIFKCLVRSGLMDNAKVSGDLTKWAKQGVLLLNAYLSTEVGTPGKHAKLWRPYMPQVISKISDFGIDDARQYCFFLWGKDAQKLQAYIDADFHIVMTWGHPSPMAQAGAPKNKRFIECDHFIRASKYLTDEGEPPIDWSLSGPTSPKLKINTFGTDTFGTDTFGTDTFGTDNGTGNGTVISGTDNGTDNGTGNVPEQIFTDGSCEKNGKRNAKGAYAAVFVGGRWATKTLCGGLPECGVADSNIRAEGWAIAKTLEFLEGEDWKVCEIYTDSDFWVKMVYEYMPKWSPANFAKKKNADLTTHLWKLWNTLLNSGRSISLIWVPAHNKRGGKNSNDAYTKWCHDNNDAADKLATHTCRNL